MSSAPWWTVILGYGVSGLLGIAGVLVGQVVASRREDRVADRDQDRERARFKREDSFRWAVERRENYAKYMVLMHESGEAIERLQLAQRREAEARSARSSCADAAGPEADGRESAALKEATEALQDQSRCLRELYAVYWNIVLLAAPRVRRAANAVYDVLAQMQKGEDFASLKDKWQFLMRLYIDVVREDLGIEQLPDHYRATAKAALAAERRGCKEDGASSLRRVAAPSEDSPQAARSDGAAGASQARVDP